MREQVAATQVPIRELSLEEVIALAISKRRRLLAKGKTSRRVGFYLKPHLIPPPTGTYQSVMGEVKIFSRFDQDRGAWFVQVRLPEAEGFKLGDYVKPDNNSGI
jgi:hypothetical protein